MGMLAVGSAGGHQLIAPIGTKIQVGCCNPKDPRPIFNAAGLSPWPQQMQLVQRINDRSMKEIEISDFCMKGSHCCMVCPYIGWVLCMPCFCKVMCCDYSTRNSQFASIALEELAGQVGEPRLEFGWTTIQDMQMGATPHWVKQASDYKPPMCQCAGGMQMAGLYLKITPEIQQMQQQQMQQLMGGQMQQAGGMMGRQPQRQGM